jgi:hypothetical protein
MNRRDYGTLHLDKVNEQERLWNITLRHKVNEHRDYGTLHLDIK